MKKHFIEHLINKYPDLDKFKLEDLISDNLLSPFQIEIPRSTIEKIATIIAAFYEMRSSPSYLEALSPELKQKNLVDPGNKGILMSYDFHLDEGQSPKLIEINTNASFLALGYEFYQSRNQELPIPGFDLTEIKRNILEEIQLFQQRNRSQTNSQMDLDHLRVATVDESPQQQKLYSEFLLYREIFKSWGWQAQILDVQELKDQTKSLDFIYNRHTDFYLTKIESQYLNNCYLNHSACISPQPFEYFLLADKERYTNWSDPGFLNALGLSTEVQNTIHSALLPSYALTPKTAEQAWSERKKLFFKPLHSFGSKQAYKGASISRGIFDAAASSGDFLAQTYISAPETTFQMPNGSSQSMKYDLRCYAYKDKFQFAIARLYQGQVTNLRALGGGFAPLKIIRTR